MKKLFAWKQVPPAENDFPRVSRLQLVEVEALAIRAWRLEGAGDATVHFEVRDGVGNWYQIKKKENPYARLPKHTQMQWKNAVLQDVRGTRGVYCYETEEFAV